MNAASAELVTYDGLPVASGGAHGLRARHPRAAWTAVQSFIDACLLPVATPTMSLRVWRSGPEPAREELIAFATRALGGPRSQDRTSMEWRLRPQAVDDVLVAIDAAGTAMPGNVSRSGPVEHGVAGRFGMSGGCESER